MDWNICLICREDTGENLRCPLDHRNCEVRNVYQTFLQNLEEFRNLEALPVDLNFGPEFTADFLLEKEQNGTTPATKNLLLRDSSGQKTEKRKQEADDGNLRRSRRQSLEANMALCISCGEQNSEKLDEYATRNAEVFSRTMASEMDDNEKLAKLSSGDLVAIEAKYYFLSHTV